eukprot:6202792-Pleurochrysis_carterae.AAC.2
MTRAIQTVAVVVFCCAAVVSHRGEPSSSSQQQMKVSPILRQHNKVQMGTTGYCSASLHLGEVPG